MARQVKRVEKVRVYETDEDRTCDKCGRAISTDPAVFLEDQNKAAQELLIYLNPEECVHYGKRRDYCPDCLDPIWNAICELIGADPDMDGDDFED